MRIPDPIANTTTEAYLAYKAGVLAKGDLKPKLYDPYIHLDAWLAYWAGLTTTYPVKGVGKNLFNGNTINAWLQPNGTPTSSTKDRTSVDYIPVAPNTSYALHGTESTYLKFTQFDSSKTAVSQQMTTSETSLTVTTGPTTAYVRIGWGNADKGATDVILERGSEATAYEPYTGEPEMLTDEEALIAYLSGVTNTYPEEFRDPADVRVAAYLKYLVSARWGRPEYPVTNEELYLSMMDAPYIPAGEPSSDIEIDDTAEAPFKDVKMYGDTSQTTYTGKNLLKMPIVSGSSNGITWTVQDDGSIILNGTSTAGVNIRANNVTIPAVEGETYTLSATGMGEAYNFGYKNSGSGENIFVVTSASPTTTAVVTSTMLSQANRLDMYIRLGKTFNNQRVTLQLEKGSSASSFEPFVGGVPAPSPDYPQAVQTVTGENVVKISDGQGNEQSYTIDLGSIELCKIGDYQDSIYKSGDKWYVHKEVGTVALNARVNALSGPVSGPNIASSDGAFFISEGDWNGAGGNYAATIGNAPLISSNVAKFEAQTLAGNVDANAMIDGTMCHRSGNNDRLYFRFSAYVGKTGDEIRAILASQGGASFYYHLDTPTDTEITNTALIDQLNALKNGGSYTGTTYIKVSATDPNLPGLLKVEAYKYD